MWRVYNEDNYSFWEKKYFPTFFETKEEAFAYAEKIGNATIEKKVADVWVEVTK